MLRVLETVLQAGTDQITLSFQRNQRSIKSKTKTFMTLNITVAFEGESDLE